MELTQDNLNSYLSTADAWRSTMKEYWLQYAELKGIADAKEYSVESFDENTVDLEWTESWGRGNVEDHRHYMPLEFIFNNERVVAELAKAKAVREAEEKVEQEQKEAIENTIETRSLAISVLSIAHAGGMPDSYWLTDTRILRACEVLRIEPSKAKEYAANYLVV